MFKFSFKKLTICITSIAALSTIAMTVGSCSGVSKTISNNMVSNDGDNTFAKGAADASLANEVQLALNNKTASAAFSKRVAGEVLYSWYKEHTVTHDGIAPTEGFYNNWTRWNDDAKKDYDDKIDSYKSQHKSDWPYYFQNEVMDPIGATTKDDYVKNSVISSVRTEFDSLVFGKSYLGVSTETAHRKNPDSTVTTYDNFRYYNPDMPVEKFNSTGNIDTIKKAPYRWQDIDFYAQTDPSYKPDNLANLSWQYAYMQHYAFQQMLEEQKPVLTSMVLWKYTDGGDGTKFKFSDMYNPDDVSSDNQKIGYQFPYFEDSDGDSDVAKGPNYEFRSFVNDGFSGTTPSLFFDTKAISVTGTSPNKNTGLISIKAGQPVGDIPYTDDSGTLFKTNLGTDNYTSSYTNYAGTVNALWNSTKAGTGNTDLYNDDTYKPTINAVAGKITDLPLTTNANNKVFNNETDILKNFLYEDNGTMSAGTDNKLPTGWNDSAAFLGTNADGTPITGTETAKNLKGLVTKGADNKYRADIFYNKDKTDEKQNDYYKNGYLWSVPAFQLGIDNASVASKFANTIYFPNGGTYSKVLPFVAVRDDGQDTSGVHVIGLDGSVYLTVPATQYATGVTDVFTTLGHGLIYPINSFIKGGTTVSKGKLDMTSTQDRENDIIKVRGLQAHVDGLKTEGASNLDFASDSNNEVKNYWTANEDRLILEIAEKQGDYGTASTDGNGDGYASGAISTLVDPSDGTTSKGDIFNIGKTIYGTDQTLFDQLFNIVELVSLRGLIQTAVTNFADSNKKIMDLYKTQTANADKELTRTGDSKILTYLFRNGLTSPYPYSLSYNYLKSADTKTYIMDSTVILSLQNLFNPINATTQDDFFHGTQSLLINAGKKFSEFDGKADSSAISSIDPSKIDTALDTIVSTYTSTYIKQNRVTTGNNQYSEHILVDFNKNPEANDLLNTFGSDSNFVNNITLQAYDKYLKKGDNGDYVGTDGTYSGKSFTAGTSTLSGTDVNDALKSQYYGTSVLGTDGTYSSYNHANVSNPIDAFGNEMYNQWYKKNISLDSTWGKNTGAGADYKQLGSSSTRIDYYKMMAALKYLTSDKDGTTNYVNFAKWLNGKVTWGNPYYLAWTNKDWNTYKDPTDPFVNKTSTWESGSVSNDDIKNYGWKNNYTNSNDVTLLGKVNNADMGTTLSNGARGINSGKTYVADSNYYHYAKPTDASPALMGYKGLISGSGDLDNGAGDLLFNNFNNANPFAPQARDLYNTEHSTTDSDQNKLYTGALAQYGDLGDWYDCSKDLTDVNYNTLTGYIYKLRGEASTSDLKELVKKLQTLLPRDSFQNVLNQLDNNKSIWSDKYSDNVPGANAQALINILTNVGSSTNAQVSTWDFKDGSDPIDWKVDLADQMNFKFDTTDGEQMVLANAGAGQTVMANAFDAITSPIEAVNFKDGETPKGGWNSASLFKSDDAGAERVLFSQVTSKMLNPYGWVNTGLTPDQAKEIVKNAITNLGSSVCANLLIQAAQDTGIQTSASRDVLNLFQANGYVTVYDRRFNDLLGASWVKDYKDKN